MLSPKVLNVIPLEHYRIQVTFESGEIKIFDVTPYISGDWFGRLKDQKVFSTVHPAGRTVEWADGQDIAPHELYECSVPIEEIISA